MRTKPLLIEKKRLCIVINQTAKTAIFIFWQPIFQSFIKVKMNHQRGPMSGLARVHSLVLKLKNKCVFQIKWLKFEK